MFVRTNLQFGTETPQFRSEQSYIYTYTRFTFFTQIVHKNIFIIYIFYAYNAENDDLRVNGHHCMLPICILKYSITDYTLYRKLSHSVIDKAPIIDQHIIL